MEKTHEGGTQHEHSLDHCLEFFSKAGSLLGKRGSFYGRKSEHDALGLFQQAFIADQETAMRLLFWLRDCRGGAGNRSGARSIYRWLAEGHHPMGRAWITANYHLVPVHGRWDDLRSFWGTPLENEVAEFWAAVIVPESNDIRDSNVLAAKWADRNKDRPVKHALGLQVAEFRRLLAAIRKGHIVEHKMCHGLWKEIAYNGVPSVAMARYTNAFGRHDEERFAKYKEALKKGETDVKASVLFPHDCVRTCIHGDADIADAQFDALPNYLEGTNERIIVVADTSGSMRIQVSGSVEAVQVSQGMALYCSEKIGRDNPFYRKFIGFCSEGRFNDWSGMRFQDAVDNSKIFDEAVGSTRIDRGLLLILKTAKFFNLTDDQMPTTLLIVSDMQFHQGVGGDGTEVEKCMCLFEEAGYRRPRIVYWNTAGYMGQPDHAFHNDIAMVSGFSPSVLKAIFAGDDMTPVGVMLRAIGKYNITRPSVGQASMATAH